MNDEKNGMIYAWLKEPGKAPEKKWIPNQLEFLQMWVNGFIETFTVTHDAVIICNEEGKINDLPYNCTVCGEQFFGHIILAGVKGDEFADIPYSEETLMDLFPGFFHLGEEETLEEMFNMKGEEKC